MAGGGGRMQRGDAQGIARGAFRGGPGIEQQQGDVAVAEETGETEGCEAVAGVLLGELAIGRQKFGNAGGGAERAGFEEVRLAAAEKQRCKLGMAGIDGPEYGAGALGRPRRGNGGIGGEQGADLVRVALADGIKDHASVWRGRDGRVLSNLAKKRNERKSAIGGRARTDPEGISSAPF